MFISLFVRLPYRSIIFAMAAVVALVALAASPLANALESKALENKNSAESLPVFPSAKLIERNAVANSYYRLALGPQKKIDNIWQAETVETYIGQLQALTQELPKNLRRADGIAFYESVLGLNRDDLRYQCDGRNCGSSNSWANNHFQIKQLYGLDQAQSYRAYQQGDDKFWALYVVKRGNKRRYLHIEQLTVNP